VGDRLTALAILRMILAHYTSDMNRTTLPGHMDTVA
jgi:hypothetical protein